MLPTEPVTPAELAQEARYARHEQRVMDRADAALVQSYRCCQCGAVHGARYVAWWGRDCTDDCGGRLEPLAVKVPVTGNPVNLQAGPM